MIEPANCCGCGSCVRGCLNQAIDVLDWSLGQFEAMVETIVMDLTGLVEVE